MNHSFSQQFHNIVWRDKMDVTLDSGNNTNHTSTNATQDCSRLPAIENDTQEGNNVTNLCRELSSAAKRDMEYAHNLVIKEEPGEIDDYEIKNVLLAVPKISYTEECIKQEGQLIVQSRSEGIESKLNIKMDNLYHITDSYIKQKNEPIIPSETPNVTKENWNIIADNLNKLPDLPLNTCEEYYCSTQTEDLVKTETSQAMDDIEDIHEISFKNWKIKSEELTAKEDPVASEIRISPEYISPTDIQNIQDLPTYMPEQKHHYETQASQIGSSVQHLLQHMNPEDVKEFKCSECEFQTYHKRNLIRHSLLHRNPEEVDKFKCNQCEFKTLHKRNLKLHVLTHVNPKEVNSFKCDQCDYETPRKSSLKQHLRRHMNPEEINKFKCSQCEYKTHRTNNLKRHLLRHINSEAVDNFKCRHCEFKAPDKGNLKLHLLTHMKSEKFQCSQCKFQTHWKWNLKIHLVRHMYPDALDKFKCSECEFQTFQKSNLNRHLLTHVNPDEVENFKCNRCEYQTHQKDYLKRHLRTHVNRDEIKKFKCNQCEYQSHQQYNLKRHLLSHIARESISLNVTNVNIKHNSHSK